MRSAEREKPEITPCATMEFMLNDCGVLKIKKLIRSAAEKCMGKRIAWLLISGTLLSLLYPSVHLLAQEAGGTISGTVVDPSGAAVPNAEITIVNLATGVKRTVKTNSAGFFSAPNLLPGTYDVSISATGFSTHVERVELNVGSQQLLNTKLSVGATEKIVVEGTPPNVDLASSTVTATVGAQTIRELPLNGRDWTMLAALEPGVHTVDTQTANSLGNTGRINRGWGTQLTVGGARPQQNNYRVDGISINDYSGGGPGSTIGGNLGVEAIQEYSVVNANPSSEYGKTSGGIFNAVTRSGTNSLHGSAYEFIRNSALDARNYFDGSSAPPFRRNQFGAALGGPVELPFLHYNGKNKTFFFFNYEGLRQSLSTTTLNQVPSTAARLGHLVGGNVSVSPAVKPFLALYPLPNFSDSGDIGIAATVQKNVTPENFFTTRVDHTISTADTLHGTFMSDNSETSAPDPLLLFAQANVSRRKMTSVEESHTFAPNLLNTARFGYSRVVAIGPTTTHVLNPILNDPSLGFLPGQPFGNLAVTQLARVSGKDPNTATYHYNSYQAYDDLYYTLGKHALKIGASLERDQLNQSTLSGQDGAWTFGSLKNFLTNASATSFVTQLPGEPNIKTYLRQSIIGAYLQDDFKVLSNLTLNVGIRYEPVTVPTEINNRLATLDTLTSPAPRLGSPYFSNPSLRNFSPRVGFSWDPFSNGKTSIRGAYGVYDLLPLLYQFELSTLLTAPFYQTATVNKTPAGSFPTGGLKLVTPDAARVSYVEQTPPRSYVQQWNLNVQRQLARNLAVQAGYVGSHGVHLPYKTQDADWVMPKQIGSGLFWPLPRGSGTEINTRVGQINGLAWIGFSRYDAANVRASWQTHNSRAELSYTWSKSIDNNTASVAGGQFTNSINGLPLFYTNYWKGLSDFDVRHLLVLNYIWQVPGFSTEHAFLHRLTNGWEWGGIFHAQSGLPFSATVGGDSLGMNNNNPFNFPDRLDTPGCGNPVNSGSVTNYIKTQCFSIPSPQNRLGDAGRNSLIGPGLVNFDTSLYKNNYIPQISETFNVQFRAEIFNVLNHANFLPPSGAATQVFTANFAPNTGVGQLTGTSTTSRQIQFGLKIIW